jgi:hypothetical protein
MYAHNLKVTDIAKRDMIYAWCKKPCKLIDTSFDIGDTIECSGYWMTVKGPYVSLQKINGDFVDDYIRFDIVLDFEDWDIYTLVKVVPA